MPLIYEQSSINGPLLQGEILANLVEYRANTAANELPPDTEVDVTPLSLPFVMVMTAVCDLEQDFNARFPEGSVDDVSITFDEDEPNPKLVQHTLFCHLYPRQEIRNRFSGMPNLWQPIPKNQNERYHKLADTTIFGTDLSVQEFYIDFKGNFTLPTSFVYQALLSESVTRVAVVPPVHVHDLMHRFYSFLSRVGVPE